MATEATRRPAAFFDLDRTVLATSSSIALARPLLAAGLLRGSDVLRSAGAQVAYTFLGADHRRSERVREELSRTVRGWDAQRLRAAVADAVTTTIQPLVHLEAIDLVTAHQDAGEDVVVVSASARDVVEPVAALLGADEVIASDMAVVDGRFTGAVEHYVYGATKAAEMRRLADERGYDLARSWAYTDSITDLPMLEAVGHPVAVNPDRALRRIALSRGWPVRRFERPVRLRTATGQAVAVAAAAGVALIGTGLAVGAALARRAQRSR